ncbi:energy transducer TonB [Candidatus Caldipriscus sp.]|nr:energy transducer TonB [Candidatus Caldipriscus sp.]
MSIKFLERMSAQNALEEEYPRDLNLAFTVSLIFFILLFLFGRGCSVEAYKPKAQQEVMGEEINIQAQLEEPPPPPPKLQISLPEEIVETTEETADTIQIKETVSFDEFSPPPPAPTQTVFEVYEVDEPPQPVVQVQPEYPEVARKAGLEGRVIVAAVVDENGNVIQAYIHSSTNSIFNDAALEAAKKMKFKPARQKDIAVKVKVLIPFVFKLTK